MMHQNMFLALLRTVVTDEPFTAVPTEDDWKVMYRMAWEQSLAGVMFAAVSKLSAEQRPPTDLKIQWMGDAETTRGLNKLLNDEAARLTKLFADEGRRSAILKGQANAKLYPDPMIRQPGDIDIWVEGGRESVVALLRKVGLVGDEPLQLVDRPGRATASYHHVHLPENKRGVVVEVHFRPSSGNYNPITNRRLQQWLEEEIKKTKVVQSAPSDGTEDGFGVPTMRFALVMQLAHIQRHFLAGGIGLRHVMDYYMLLRHASAEDRQMVEGLLKRCGLRHTAEALMWVLGEALHLEHELMLCRTDSWRGEWMLRRIMDGGNFGQYAPQKQYGLWRRFFTARWQQVKMIRFDFREVIWIEIKFWKRFVELIPARIRYRTLSLNSIQKK